MHPNKRMEEESAALSLNKETLYSRILRDSSDVSHNAEGEGERAVSSGVPSHGSAPSKATSPSSILSGPSSG